MSDAPAQDNDPMNPYEWLGRLAGGKGKFMGEVHGIPVFEVDDLDDA